MAVGAASRLRHILADRRGGRRGARASAIMVSMALEESVSEEGRVR
jgi:hypothetical protein